LLAIVTVPDTFPAEAGENFAANDVLCSAARFIGDRPLMLNPAPDATA
jgi:hypothetical protein